MRILGLDLVRFAAAFMVMVYHLGYLAWAWNDGPLIDGYPRFTEIAGWSWTGWVGVQIFFVLSGFVIAYSASGATPSRFLRSRFLRLAPALWTCAAITFVVTVLSGRFPLPKALADLGRSAILYPFGPWVDGVYWTLVVEVIFYAAVFALLATNLYRHIEKITAGWVLLAVAYNVADLIWSVPGSRPAMYLLISSGPFFALGIYFWLTMKRGRTLGRMAGIAACLVGGSAQIYVKAASHPIDQYFPVLVWAAGVAAIVASIRFREAVEFALAKVARPVQVIGLSTYPLYLLHSVIGTILVARLHAAGLDRWAALAAGCAAMVGLSFFVVLAIEPIVKRALERPVDRLLAANGPRAGRKTEAA